jgi:hypothetical protein
MFFVAKTWMPGTEAGHDARGDGLAKPDPPFIALTSTGYACG